MAKATSKKSRNRWRGLKKWISNKFDTAEREGKVDREAPQPIQAIKLVASDSFLGFVYCSIFAYAATIIFYLFLNNVLFHSASPTTVVSSWSRYSNEELQNAYLFATGTQAAQTSGGEADAFLREELNFEILPVYDERLRSELLAVKKPANQENSGTTEAIGGKKHKATSEQIRAMIEARAVEMTQSWPNLTSKDAEILASNCHKGYDDTLTMLDLSIPENGSELATALKNGKLAAQNRSPDGFRFRWGPTQELKFELLLERVHASPVLVSANFRPLLVDDQSSSDVYVPQRVLVPSIFSVIEERTVFPLFGLTPINCSFNSENIANRFFPLLEENIRGLSLPSGGLVSDNDEVTKLEQAEEEHVTRLLNYLIGIRLAKKQDSARNQVFATFDSDQLVSQPQTDFLDPSKAFLAKRILNGSDFWGCIQYMTFWCFFYLLILLFCKYNVASVQSYYLDRDDIFENISDAKVQARDSKSLKRIISNRIQAIEKLRGLYFGISNDSNVRSMELQCIPLELALAGCSGINEEGYSDVPTFVGTRSEHLLERVGTHFNSVRYFAWALPSIGFVGTVLGIGNALQGTSGVISPDKLAVQSAIQGMSQTLGTAFDTTFVALILSIFAVAGIHFVQGKYENLVHDSVDKTIGGLIDKKLQFQESVGETRSQPRRPDRPRKFVEPKEKTYISPNAVRARPVHASLIVDSLAIVLIVLLALGGLVLCYSNSELAKSFNDAYSSFTETIWNSN